MKDEIKEIQERLNYHKAIGIEPEYCEDLITTGELQRLLDYIINLQTIEQQYSAILSENAELENKITNLQETKNILSTKVINQKDELYRLNNKITNLQEENEKLKINKAKALDYIRMHCEIRRNEENEYDEIGKVEAMPIYSILDD